ncbi:ectonucleotide pyrophosphatase/phosphodiesterase [Colwellia sp. 1_MG-2023]|uniref:alkaline phosphatase family protein n=1 Tax=Colwellia sp. 1_MG-2023 TaxID=3062649 RepID=UPI0026E3A9BE|nr:ectonucleotide pyrophosphatase/phosphodiesterase [Colwellia sp. 1_MG-2023]MDO6446941.1 ectonucleotide pyrophosphatase/phosphodiesterase [Colwellia sp. 1_MG-2023]
MNRFIIICLLTLSTNCFANNPLILLSIDGFSHDYLAQYKPKNILSLANKGVMAKGLTPVFPSKTFPNHLSIVTGMYPANHGIVHNSFYHRELKKQYSLGAGKNNSTWLTAKPIWTVAEQQGVKSAIYFWPESETKADGVLPSYYFKYKHSEPNINRINQIVDWLKLPEPQRPGFIAGYFSTIDDAGHKFGPDAKELANAIKEIDSLIGKLIEKITVETKVTPNILLVSDHGMTPIDKQRIILRENLLSNFPQLHVVNGQTQLYIYEDDEKLLNDVRSHLISIPEKQHYQVFKQSDFPKHWHLNDKNAVIPDMIVNALPPTIFKDEIGYTSSATHGYDAINHPELSAIFIAQGPDIKNGLTINAFENIHIYSLMETLLELPVTSHVDSNSTVLSKLILKDKI